VLVSGKFGHARRINNMVALQVVCMVLRVHERQRVMEHVHSIMKSYDNAELIMGELVSLGFLRVSGSSDPYVLEHDGLELYLRIRLNRDMSVAGYDLLTFDELREEMAVK
jgi:hypothetical protein